MLTIIKYFLLINYSATPSSTYLLMLEREEHKIVKNALKNKKKYFKGEKQSILSKHSRRKAARERYINNKEWIGNLLTEKTARFGVVLGVT